MKMNSLKAVLAAFASALLLVACASYDGRGLVPGKSTEAEVVGLMGQPAQTLKGPGGGKLLYFSRLPLGRDIYKATIGADGVLRSLEQTLTRPNISKIAVNSTTTDQVSELLGPPYRITREPFKPWNVWEYPWRLVDERRILWVSFSDDGVVRDVIEMHDFESDPVGGSGKDV
jgi:hypothetical protein